MEETAFGPSVRVPWAEIPVPPGGDIGAFASQALAQPFSKNPAIIKSNKRINTLSQNPLGQTPRQPKHKQTWLLIS
jgi:hypothetical protein